MTTETNDIIERSKVARNIADAVIMLQLNDLFGGSIEFVVEGEQSWLQIRFNKWQIVTGVIQVYEKNNIFMKCHNHINNLFPEEKITFTTVSDLVDYMTKHFYNAIGIKPLPQMGLTILVGTDKYPGTIHKVSETGKTLWYAYDIVEDNQTFHEDLSDDIKNNLIRCHSNDDNKWVDTDGNMLIIGKKEFFLDGTIMEGQQWRMSAFQQL